MTTQPGDGRTPFQADRDTTERTGKWPANWGPYHRHFASDAVHRDGGPECDQPGTPRRVYVFDPDALDEHEAIVARWGADLALQIHGGDGKPDIRYFAEDGAWVKPSGAVRVDIVLQAGGGGAVTGAGPVCAGRGPDGALTVHAIPADELPGLVEVRAGRGGSPGGRDGYALIVTHLTEGGRP
jgi:hypothetical protein